MRSINMIPYERKALTRYMMDWGRGRRAWARAMAERLPRGDDAVSNWWRNGSRSGLLRDSACDPALDRLEADEQKALLKRWLKSMLTTYRRLRRCEGKSPLKIQRDRQLALILKLYVFDSESLRGISAMIGYPHQLRRSYIAGLLADTADEIAPDAAAAGLFDEWETLQAA